MAPEVSPPLDIHMLLRPLDDAQAELARVWSASDHFDQKVLQFVGIVTAGCLAGASLTLERIRNLPPGAAGWIVLALVLAVAVCLLTFMFRATRSVLTGTGFAGGLDPRILARRIGEFPDLEAYQRSMLQAIGEAFERSLNGHEWKWRELRAAMRSLKMGLVLLSLALFTWIVAERIGGGHIMDHATEPTGTPAETSNSTPAPAPKPEPIYPVLGPYEITKGEKIPNVPIDAESSRAAKR